MKVKGLATDIIEGTYSDDEVWGCEGCGRIDGAVTKNFFSVKTDNQRYILS